MQCPPRSEELAEFVGIMLGDGGMTSFQISITLGYKSDREYSVFVSALLKRLFLVAPSIYERDQSIIDIRISRKVLVNFCVSLGLCIGNKIRNKVDIPHWIKQNKIFLTACVRGMMDTDGCIFQECHAIGEKKYCYPRIALVSYSNTLRLSVFEGLKKLGFSPKERNGRSINLENKGEIQKYFSLVGTHNPKHQKRFEEFIWRGA